MLVAATSMTLAIDDESSAADSVAIRGIEGVGNSGGGGGWGGGEGGGKGKGGEGGPCGGANGQGGGGEPASRTQQWRVAQPREPAPHSTGGVP